MNLFRKEMNHDLEESNEKKELEDFDQYAKMPDPEKTVSEETKKQGDLLYSPDPVLFKRLLEGTSFDHRKKAEPQREKAKKEKIEASIAPIPQPKKEFLPDQMPIPTSTYIESKKIIPTGKNLKRKKFIGKARENRLEYLVDEVLGYPKKQNH